MYNLMGMREEIISLFVFILCAAICAVWGVILPVTGAMYFMGALV